MSSIKSKKDRILEKIDEKIKGMFRKLDENPEINAYDAVNLAGWHDALYRLKEGISSIDVEAPSETPRHLNTSDKFLNAAYDQVVLIKESPQNFEGGAGKLGKEGKNEAIEEIMDYIKSLIEA